MTDNIDLIALKDKINNVTEKLNEQIKLKEKELESLQFGLDVWIKLSDNISLGYGKFNKDWHILVNYGDFEEDRKVIPLLNAKRALRVYCYPKIDLIIPALIERSESFVKDVENILNKNN